MSYGLLVNGEEGRLLVDPNYSNYTMVASGIVTLSYIGASVCEGTVPVPSFYINPMVIFSPPVGKPISYWGTRLFGRNGSSFGVSYRILVPVSSVSQSSESYGVRIWDVSGKMVFDSGHTVMDIISTYYYSGTSLPTISANLSEWVAATSWGVVALGDYAGGGGNTAEALCIYLKKLSNGNFSSSMEINLMVGPGPAVGERLAYNSIYLNRCNVI
jgi:hypothetical protein